MDLKNSNAPKNRYKTYLFFLVSISLFSFLSPSATYSQDIGNIDILVLHSFHKGHVWNDSITKGIESALSSHSIPSTTLRIHYEYIDVERFNNPDLFQNLYEFIENKYTFSDIDLIIASDDPAFNFLFKYQRSLFPATPVVFCGVNYFDEFEMFGHELFTGVVESIDILKTVNLALHLHPKTKEVLVIVDKSQTSIATIKTFIQNFKHFKNAAMFSFIPDLTIEEVQLKLSHLPNDTLVLYVNFTSDRSGKTFAMKESLDLLTKYCNVPIYSFWDSYLGHGIVGGMLASGNAQGKKAAEIALRILKGEYVHHIPVVNESPNSYMFDYKQLQQFRIKRDLLPKESEVVNIPFSFYSEYKKLVWIVASSITALALIIFVLLANISKRKRVEISLKRFSNQLNVLHEIDRAILEEDFSEKAANDVLRYVRNLYSSFRASLFIFDFHKQTATVMAVDADQSSKLTPGAVFPISLFDADALREGKPIWIDDLKPSKKSSVVENLLKEDGISGYVSIPLISNEELIGSLNLSGCSELHLHSERIDIIQEVAVSLAVAIRNTLLLKEVMEHEKELEKLSATVVETQELTCRRISFELHDEIGQVLTGATINLSAIQKVLPSDCNPKVKNLLIDTQQIMDRLSEQTHDLSLNLWPPMLRDFGIEATLRWYLDRIGDKANIQTLLDVSNLEERPTEEIETAIYRIVQEASTNVIKHAQASNLEVSLVRKKETAISIFIRDNGRGFNMDEFVGDDKIKDRLGLLGMRERIAFLGGRLKIWSQPGIGTHISADIPWRKRRQNEQN